MEKTFTSDEIRLWNIGSQDADIDSAQQKAHLVSDNPDSEPHLMLYDISLAQKLQNPSQRRACESILKRTLKQPDLDVVTNALKTKRGWEGEQT